MSNEVAVREPDVSTLAQVVEGIKRPDRHDQLLSLLGSEAAVERFVTVSLQSISGNTDLLKSVTVGSLLESIKEAAVLDLEPTGLLGEAWIIKHGNRAVLRIGWRGFLKMIRREPDIQMIDTQIVYDNDFFDIQLGTDPQINHIPTLGERGNYKGAYAWARTVKGELYIEWMNVDDIQKVRKSSSAATRGPWNDWWSEMARKSVVRRLAKRLPLHSVGARQVVAHEEDEDEQEESQAQVRAARARSLALLAAATTPQGSAEADQGNALQGATGDREEHLQGVSGPAAEEESGREVTSPS